ncbi:hypothetical protein NEPAR06_2097 [Nematocida parisii]|nr:hypothetical protein NEPAR08_1916 [Nematocida parisii]KAI5130222.1 hypothetical protein NEPAR03_2008 [Nematocida parisii]KAI5145661.1 hypothetical protein NEPAR07_1854 [Nematocida parisii]KAI5155976.1 hypothetical protein NEPAR06_2097 [Nematocida parisii]KAI5158417.1 hypothetical protein NEPAR05_1960 [Nematocida parisii]
MILGRSIIFFTLYLCCLWMVSADNYHSEGVKRIVCNGSELNVKCTGTRWKISYLGTDESVSIEETGNSIYITGVEKTFYPTKYMDGSILYPDGYRLVLHSDVVYNGVPIKIIIMASVIFLIIAVSFLLFLRLEVFFLKEDKWHRKYFV